MIITNDIMKEKLRYYSNKNNKISREVKNNEITRIIKGLYETENEVMVHHICLLNMHLNIMV